MRQVLVIGAMLLVMCGLAWLVGGQAEVEAGSANGPTPAQRLATLEHKMANIEKVVGFSLDDDAAVAEMVREREATMASARVRSLMSMLMTIRSQNELYQVQHKGVYPDLGRGWDQLIEGTDADGRIVQAEKVNRYTFGPYLKQRPVNPYTFSSKVVTRPQDVGPAVGWYYQRESGELKAVVPRSEAKLYELDSSDVLTY